MINRESFNDYIDSYRFCISEAGKAAFENRFMARTLISYIQYMKVFHVLRDYYTPPKRTTGK